MPDASTQCREPTGDEKRVLTFLADKAGTLEPRWMDGLQVREMNDGGMGSLRLLVPGVAQGDRKFGEDLAALEFLDSDGVKVIVTLQVDESGHPFELDVWKTDFTPVKKLGLQDLV